MRDIRRAEVGLRGLIPILLLMGGLGEYSAFSRFVSATVPSIAGNFGLRFEAEEWSFHPFALKAVARHVRIVPEHGGHDSTLASASEVEFRASIGTSALFTASTSTSELGLPRRDILGVFEAPDDARALVLRRLAKHSRSETVRNDEWHHSLWPWLNICSRC